MNTKQLYGKLYRNHYCEDVKCQRARDQVTEKLPVDRFWQCPECCRALTFLNESEDKLLDAVKHEYKSPFEE